MKNLLGAALAREEVEQEDVRKEAAARELDGTLFGLPIAEPLRQITSQYPYPARLNGHQLRRFQASSRGKTYRKGALLFEQGRTPEGVYVILDGRVKLSVNSRNGKEMIVGFFGPGTVLELAAVVLGRAHISTAETVQPTRAVFVSRKQLIAEIQAQPLAAWHVTQLVCEHCYFLLTKMAAVELSESAQQKMARCLLGLINNHWDEGARVEMNLTQEVIAQMVGLSRETVSRLLSRLRRMGVVDWKRADFVIRDRRALERLADFPGTAGESQARRYPEAVTRNRRRRLG